MNEIRFAMWELINIRINYKCLVNSWHVGGINFRQLGGSCHYSIIIIIIIIFFFYKST